MKTNLSLFLSLAAFTLPLMVTRADPSVSTVAFSNPDKPGTFKVNLGRGDIRIREATGGTVTVTSDSRPAPSKPGRDNLRVLTSVSEFNLTEKDNTVTLDAAAQDLGRNSGDCDVAVPPGTTIVIQNVGGGDIRCVNTTGDIDINSSRGEIHLDRVSGGVVVAAMKGEIHLDLREVRKPVSITSLGGEVSLRLPEDARANVRFRTHNGSVLTEFDDKALVTRTEQAGPMRVDGNFNFTGADGKKMSASVSASASSGGSDNSNSNSSSGSSSSSRSSSSAEIEPGLGSRKRNEQMKEMQVVQPERKTEARFSSAGGPSISGGKLVIGTLNGGGPEINIATLNGDVVLRKLPPQ